MMIDPTDPVLKIVHRHLPDLDEDTIEDLVDELNDYMLDEILDNGESDPLAHDCPSCWHRHTGANYAFVCIGCPCPERPGKNR